CVFVCTFIVLLYDTTTPDFYTLSLHDALPISFRLRRLAGGLEEVRLGDVAQGDDVLAELEDVAQVAAAAAAAADDDDVELLRRRDRKSTRLNSSHVSISYAVFCLKKKKTISHI